MAGLFELLKNARDEMGVSALKDMSPEQINEVFQNLHDENKAYAEEIKKLRKDARRLNYLDACNAEFNKKMGSNYGWKVDWNCNRIAVVDTGFAGVSVRQAIDEFIERRGDS